VGRLYSVNDKVMGVVALANGNYVVVSEFGTRLPIRVNFQRAATWATAMLAR